MSKASKHVRLPRRVIGLGRCVEIRFQDGRTWKTGSRMVWLCSSESGKTLWVLPVSKEDHSRISNSALYKAFHGWEAHGVRISKLREPKSLKSFGKVKAVVYASRKWGGKNHSYIHTFRTKPTAYSNSAASPTLIKISGGKIRVKPEGITG